MKKITHLVMEETLGGSSPSSIANCMLDAYSNHGVASVLLGFATWVSYGGATLITGAACYAQQN